MDIIDIENNQFLYKGNDIRVEIIDNNAWVNTNDLTNIKNEEPCYNIINNEVYIKLTALDNIFNNPFDIFGNWLKSVFSISIKKHYNIEKNNFDINFMSEFVDKFKNLEQRYLNNEINLTNFQRIYDKITYDFRKKRRFYKQAIEDNINFMITEQSECCDKAKSMKKIYNKIEKRANNIMNGNKYQ